MSAVDEAVERIRPIYLDAVNRAGWNCVNRKILTANSDAIIRTDLEIHLGLIPPEAARMTCGFLGTIKPHLIEADMRDIDLVMRLLNQPMMSFSSPVIQALTMSRGPRG